MNFREWLILEKFINSKSHFCGLCKTPLRPLSVVFNPKHIYTYGQMHICKCGKSRIWANSVRNEDKLVMFLNGQLDRYTNGFCNDPYCGFCFGYIYPLKNGVPSPFPEINYNLDLWGCPKGHNDNILVHGQAEWKENETGEIMAWYKAHTADLIKAIRQNEGEEAA